MPTFYQSLDIAINNLKRLNRLYKRNLLDKEGLKEFELYKTIVKANDTGAYSPEVKAIINK